MIRSILLGSAAGAALLAGGAMAADLPVRGPAPAPVMVAPIFTWTGFYIGLNAGAAFNQEANVYNPYGFNVSDINFYGYNRSDDSSFTGGAQIGYNWQFAGGWVLGLEADINWLDRGGDRVALPGAPLYPYFALDRGGDNGDWYATFRTRLGYSFGQALLYVTGGLAYANNDAGASSGYFYGANVCTAGCFFEGNRSSVSDWGWTLGAGVEWAFSPNWSAKLEYLHVEFDGESWRSNYNGTIGGLGYVTGKYDASFDVVRVGLNYRFGGGYRSAPVVARY